VLRALCSENRQRPLDHLKAFEVALHQHDVRTNSEKLRELLHPDFVEIGYSGRTFDFKSTLDRLLSESASSFRLWSQSYEFCEYAPNIVQVIYLSANLGKDGDLSRHSKRTSIWVNASGIWQMKFHQATPVPAFEKSNA